MVDQPVEAGASLPAGHLQSVESKVGSESVGHSPAEDSSQEHVGDEAGVGELYTWNPQAPDPRGLNPEEMLDDHKRKSSLVDEKRGSDSHE